MARQKRKRALTSGATIPQSKPVKRKLESNPKTLFHGVPIVTLHVGEEKVPFHVHMDILCRASSVFKAAFMGSGTFRETSENSMALPEDDPKAFENLVQWLYFKKTPLDNMIPVGNFEQSQDLYLDLASLYVTADKYNIGKLTNKVVDRLYEFPLEKDYTPPQIETVDFVYERTTSKSQLRRLFVEFFVWTINFDYYDKAGVAEGLHERPEFAVDLAISMATRINRGLDPWGPQTLGFHERRNCKGGQLSEHVDDGEDGSTESSSTD